MLERIAARAGKLAESVADMVGDWARADLSTVRNLRYAEPDSMVNSALFVPNAFGKFSLDMGKEKPFLSYAGNRPGTFPVNPHWGGGQIHIDPNGTAIRRVNGTEETYDYRAFRYGPDSLRYMLYKPGLDARDTLAGTKDFLPGGGYFAPIANYLRWDLSADADRIGREIPRGSVPIGFGDTRQTWQTPADEALMIGPPRSYPYIPGLLQPKRDLVVGTKQLEWFPLGENHSVTTADAERVNARIRQAGYTVGDPKLANYVRTRDGTVWRIDPEEIELRGNAVHRPDGTR